MMSFGVWSWNSACENASQGLPVFEREIFAVRELELVGRQSHVSLISSKFL